MKKRSLLAFLAGLCLLAVSTSSFALKCVETGTNSASVLGTISTNIPVPADAPNGTIIWESPTISVNITCSHDWGYNAEDVWMYVNPAKATVAPGTGVGIRTNGTLYQTTSGTMTQFDTGHVIPAGTSATAVFTFTFSVVVTKQGATPASGSASFNSFRVFQLDGSGGLNITPNYNLNYYLTGNVRFIGCFANLTFAPSNTVDFGTIPATGTLGEVASQGQVTLTATSACQSPYGLQIGFQPVSGTLVNPTTWDIGSGWNVGISLIDPTTSTAVTLDGTPNSFVDLTSVSSASKTYNAQLTRLQTQSPTGQYSAVMMVNLFYY